MTSASTRSAPSTSIFPVRSNTLARPSTGESALSSSSRPGRALDQPDAAEKGKAPLRTGASKPSIDSTTCGEDEGFVKVTKSVASVPFTPYDESPTPTVKRKNRGSILGSASSALGFTFGRKRPVRQIARPVVLPDVIEISAPPPDHEVEERNRLREMAAQAIGISPYMAQPDSHSHENSTEDDEDDYALRTPADASDLRRFGDLNKLDSATDRNLAIDTNLPSVVIPQLHLPMLGHHRSGPTAHARANSTTFVPIPFFPTNVLALNPFLACNGYLPKYSQPSSMRLFSLSSRNWKSRYIVFTTPSVLHFRSHNPPKSYLHVFKSSGPDEKEMERLEINEDSVIFVAEEEVGGRRGVIKVGGIELGSLKPNVNAEKAQQQVMWHLQILDSSESQKWISTIKNSILGQRTVRAGFGLPSTPTGIEPRGDLDVMLSIRAQSYTTHLQSSSVPSHLHEPASPTLTHSDRDRHYASSVSSQSIHSQSTVPKPHPVSALKGLFGRPRSSSKATSMDGSSDRHSERELQQDGSFSGMGNNLLKMRSNTVSIVPATGSTNSYSAAQQRNTLPFGPKPSQLERPERKVLSERQAIQWVNQPSPHASSSGVRTAQTRTNRAMSLGSASLQPPPRKRWGSTTTRPTTPPADEQEFTYVNRSPSSTTVFARRTSIEKPDAERAEFGAFAIPPPETRARTPSLQSVLTHVSENAASLDRSNSSRASPSNSRRWSRQLPQRLTPPAGPVPAIPASASAVRLTVYPQGLGDRMSSNASTHSSTHSSISTLPSFSKRASTSSAHSISTSGHSLMPPSSRPMRHSLPPPPKPAPTSALPPAPVPAPESELTPTPPPLQPTPQASKSSFRNSVAQRAMRLSMIAAPKPPPSTTLPPRPDEHQAEVNSNPTPKRRSWTSGIASPSGMAPGLDTIPEPFQAEQASFAIASPYPPPMGPLPPTPGGSQPMQVPTSTMSRHSSLKQRLRILSAPSTMSPVGPLPPTPPTPPCSTNQTTPVPANHLPQSLPCTPMGDTFYFGSGANGNGNITIASTSVGSSSHDFSSSFMQMNTPVLSDIPPARIFEEAVVEKTLRPVESVELLEHVTSLSPPPRRLSKAVIESSWIERNGSTVAATSGENERGDDNANDNDQDKVDNDKNRRVVAQWPSRIFSLSPPGSVVSLPTPISTASS